LGDKRQHAPEMPPAAVTVAPRAADTEEVQAGRIVIGALGCVFGLLALFELRLATDDQPSGDTVGFALFLLLPAAMSVAAAIRGPRSRGYRPLVVASLALMVAAIVLIVLTLKVFVEE
jgi:hypothetical protein